MENNQEAANPESGDAAVVQMNFAQRVSGVYFEPKKTFEDLGRSGSWLGIFVILSVLAMSMSYVTNLKIDRETRIRQGLEMSPIKLSEAQKEAAITGALSNPPGVMERFGFLFAPISILIMNALLAAIFLLMFVILGAGINYKKSLIITFWAMAPPSIVMMALSIVMLFVKDPEKLEIDPSLNVASNLGILISDHKAQPVLASLMSSLDLFSIWSIILLSLGFSAISNGKMNTKKAATGVLILWALWVGCKAGWKAIF